MIDLIGVAYKAIPKPLEPNIIPDDDGTLKILVLREIFIAGFPAVYYDVTIRFCNYSIQVSVHAGTKGFSVLLQGEDLNSDKLVTTIENCLRVFQAWT